MRRHLKWQPEAVGTAYVDSGMIFTVSRDENEGAYVYVNIGHVMF